MTTNIGDIVDDEEHDEGILRQLGSKAKPFQPTLDLVDRLANRERKSTKTFDISLQRGLWQQEFLTVANIHILLLKIRYQMNQY